MKIVVTGGFGFVGKHLTKRFIESNKEFVLFDKKKHDLFKPKTLKSLLHSANVVVHLAGINRDDDFTNIVKVNALGTKGLLDAMLTYCPTAKIIFASSFQAYLKNNIYGASKQIAEDFIHAYTKESRLKGIVLRITNLYGPGCKPFYNSVIATFAYQIKKGNNLVINADGSQKRDYLYVEDGVDAIFRAIDFSPTDYEVFDICTGKKVSIRKLVNLIQDVSHKKIRVQYNKEIKSDDWNLSKNYSKAKRLLAWEPRVDLRTGIKYTFEDLHENKN